MTIKSEKTREEFKNNILGHLVPKYKADTLDLVKKFPFITVSLSVDNGSFKISKKGDILVAEKDIKDTDLIVDVSQMDKVNLNISAGIQAEEVISTAPDPSKMFCKYHKLSNSRHLELRCRVDKL